MIRLCVFVLLLMMLSCTAQREVTSVKSEKFSSSKKMILVKGTLNGKATYFVVDTGASFSVLDESQQRRFGFNVYDSDEEAVGYGGTSGFKGVTNASVTIMSARVSTVFKSNNLSTLTTVVTNSEGKHVSGIIGSDVLRDLGAIIDYSSGTITITKNRI